MTKPKLGPEERQFIRALLDAMDAVDAGDLDEAKRVLVALQDGGNAGRMRVQPRGSR